MKLFYSCTRFLGLPLLAMALFSGCAGHHCRPSGERAPEAVFEPAWHYAPPDAPGLSYPLWRTRNFGKPVLLLHHLPGLDEEMLALARDLERGGFRVYAPNLYGRESFAHYGPLKGKRLAQASGRWDLDSHGDPGKVLEDIRAMTREVSAREQGKAIAVIGNCLTGILPLALLSEPCVEVAVICQPATPMQTWWEFMMRRQSSAKSKALGISERDFARAVEVLKQSGTQLKSGKRIVGLHYFHDPIGAFDKFRAIHERLESSGVAGRFRTLVAYPVGRGVSEPWWTHRRETRMRSSMLNPAHSTLTSADPDDRAWFRDTLIDELGQ